MRTSSSFGGVTVLDAWGDVVASYDQIAVDGTELSFHDGLFLDDGSQAAGRHALATRGRRSSGTVLSY